MSDRTRPLLLQRAILCVALVVAATGEARAQVLHLEKAARVQTVTPQQVLQTLLEGEGPVIVDTRNASHYLAGHIPGAVNVHHKEVWGRLETLRRFDAERGLVFYDRKGIQSKIASRAVLTEGFRRVAVMEGHFEEWVRLGYPVARGVPGE